MSTHLHGSGGFILGLVVSFDGLVGCVQVLGYVCPRS